MVMYMKAEFVGGTSYMVCPESIQPINIKKKVTDLEQWYLSPLQSTPLGTTHTYPSILSTFQNNLKSPFS